MHTLLCENLHAIAIPMLAATAVRAQLENLEEGCPGCAAVLAKRLLGLTEN